MTEQERVVLKIREAAWEQGNEVRAYSGRGMYGAECIAVTTDEPEDLIALAGVKGARTDSMGRSTVVYWPAVPYSDPDDDDDDSDDDTLTEEGDPS